MIEPRFKPSQVVYIVIDNVVVIIKVEKVLWEQYKICYLLTGYNYTKIKIERLFEETVDKKAEIFNSEIEAKNTLKF